MANQTTVNFINESAKTQSISITELGYHIGIDAEHQIQIQHRTDGDAPAYDLFWVSGYRDAAYEIFPETIDRVANELKSNPQRRSF